MAWQGWLLYGVVALWLLPASFTRPVALALLLQWFAGEVQFLYAGDYEPMLIWVAGDMAVFATVLMFRSHWTDWLILLPYPLVWWLYMQPESQTQWMALYWIVVCQMLLAGPWMVIQKSLREYNQGDSRLNAAKPLAEGSANEGL